MRSRLFLVLLVFFVAVACGPAAEPEPEPEPVAEAEPAPMDAEAAVEAIRLAYIDHYNAGDAAGLAAMFTEEAWYLPADGSVNQGPAAIEAALAGTLAMGSATLDISTNDTVVMGDSAMSRGAYSVEMTTEGADPVTFSGNYISAMENVDGEWKLSALLSNYNAPPAEGMAASPAPEQRFPDLEDNPVGDLLASYVDHYNQGHANVVAGLYAENGAAAFADTTITIGREAIEEYLTGAMEEMGSPQLTIHTTGARDLGDGHYGAGGWFEIDSDTGRREGHWLALVITADDGSQLIGWGITNVLHAGM